MTTYLCDRMLVMKTDFKKMVFVGGFIVSLSLTNVSLGADLITKNLFQGIKDSEVIILQKFLNSYPDTVVSSDGSGSLGNETDYFGIKTKEAVIKFQNKYASEVLAPAGLITGTGYVGSFTRQKINSILSTAVSNPSVTKTTVTTIPLSINISTTTSATTTLTTTPKITKISPSILNDGDELTIYGSGFTDKNTVYLSIEQPNKYQNIKSTNNGTVIKLNINTTAGSVLMTSLNNAFSSVTGTLKDQVISNLFTGFRRDNNQTETGERTMLVTTTIRVDNENGKSNEMTESINIFKEI